VPSPGTDGHGSIAATLQILADGRFTLGLGSGENLNEHAVGRGWQVNADLPTPACFAGATQFVRPIARPAVTPARSSGISMMSRSGLVVSMSPDDATVETTSSRSSRAQLGELVLRCRRRRTGRRVRALLR
jgi:hypothetical protein